MWGFAKSVLVGTVAGAILPLFITVPLGISNFMQPLGAHRDFLALLYLALLPLIVAFAVVLPASVAIGIPVFITLRKLNAESVDFYVLCGTAFGLVVPIFVLAMIKAEGGYWMCVLGAFSGAATAHTWSRSRSS